MFLSVKTAVCFSLLFLFLPLSAVGLDLGSRVQVHGFLSQGYLESNGNNFLGDTLGGSFDFREVGINLNARITDTLRLGGQLLYRDFVDSSDGTIFADWLVADYHFQDFLGTRIGKIKMPMGLYNMERDTDFLRPLVFLPQSIYDETRRDSWQAHWGGELYGNLYFDGWGDLDYQLFAGKIDYTDDSPATRATAEIVLRNNRTNDQNLATDELTMENNYVYGGALFFNPPVDGLRSSLTFLSLDDATWINSIAVSSLHIRAKIVASLEYSWKKFNITGEYSEMNRIQKQFGNTTLDGWSRAWYLLLSYSPVAPLTFSLFYDDYYRLKDNDEPVGVRNPYPWRKDFAVAVRYDISENWTLKGEYHTLDGTAFYMNYFNPDGTERYWQYATMKLTFNF